MAISQSIESERYLRQLGSGHIYHWTPTLAKRKDMVIYDPELAKSRIEALNQRLADEKAQQTPEAIAEHQKAMADAQQDAHIITDLEQQLERSREIERAEIENLEKGQDIKPEEKIMSDQDIELERRDKILATDPHIKNIMGMTSKNQVEAYVLQEFGEDLDRRKSLGDLKNYALKKRTDRLFEFEG